MRLLPIGNGALMQSRLGPAWAALFPADELVRHVAELLAPLDAAGLPVDAASQAQIDAIITRLRLPLIIASPPQTHMHYLRLAHKLGLPCVLEKPITQDADDLAAFLASGMADKCFCLSYYALEKALSLRSLFSPHPLHDALLCAQNAQGVAISMDEARALFNTHITRHPITSARFLMLEDDGRSVPLTHPGPHWTEDRSTGGQWLDMGVHMACLLAITGLLPTGDLAINTGLYAPRLAHLDAALHARLSPHRFSLHFTAHAADVTVEFGKYTCATPDQAQRLCKMAFSDGSFVKTSFESQQTTLHGPDHVPLLTIKPDQAQLGTTIAYGPQCTLARTFLQNGHMPPTRSDSLHEQSQALKLLLGLMPAAQATTAKPYMRSDKHAQ